jgi:hypothetical protein
MKDALAARIEKTLAGLRYVLPLKCLKSLPDGIVQTDTRADFTRCGIESKAQVVQRPRFAGISRLSAGFADDYLLHRIVQSL